jgi:hypothetical protein
LQEKKVKIVTLLEVLVAAHLTAFVDSDQFPERGGIMFIGPPGNLKTTIIKQALKPYQPAAAIMSDLNVETLGRMKPHMANGHITTLALPAFEKLYERNPQTANNLEGHLKGLVDEGFSNMSFQDQRMLGQIEAHALVVGGLVNTCYQKKFSKWDDEGFARRFIWSSFQLKDPGILTQAIHNWERLEFESRAPIRPQNKIKMTVTKEESKALMDMMRQQHCEATPYALMKKILAALKWKFHRSDEQKRPMQIMKDFAESLGQRSARLEI